MKLDDRAAEAKYSEIRKAAMNAKLACDALSDAEIEVATEAFARVTPPEEPELVLQLITVRSLHNAATAQSCKPGNVVLNWRKLVDIVPDVSLAGLGAATLPIAPAWSTVLAGLYIWNKLWKGALEDFNETEAITIVALWKHRNGHNKIAEDEGFAKTNDLRRLYALSELTRARFTSVIDRLAKIDCVELDDGSIWLREWVRIKYQ